MVANCVHNVVNALALRHLPDFKFPITHLPGTPYIYNPKVYLELADLFHTAYRLGAWRAGKSAARQAQIQDSLDWDRPRLNAALSHIKTQIEISMPKKARLIQAFHRPADNYSCADLYRAYSEALVHWSAVPRTHLGMYVHVRSACGLNHQDIANQINLWLDELASTPYAILMDDVSNMDGSIQVPHLTLQVQLYQALDARMAHDLQSSIRYRGLVRTKQATVTYTAVGTVRSGAQDTSSGQTTRRMDMFVRVCASLGVTQVRAFVFGDDILGFIVHPPETPAAFDRAHESMGLQCRANMVYDLCKADFLACTFVPTNQGGYVMVPKPGRLLAKLFWTWRDVPPRRRHDYIAQVASAFLTRYHGFDFMVAWLTWHVNHVPDLRWHGDLPLFQPCDPVSCDWQAFVARRYGLPMPPQELVQYIRSIPPGGVAILASDWTRAVIEFDLADPVERNEYI